MEHLKVKNDSWVVKLAKEHGGLSKYQRRTDTCELRWEAFKGLLSMLWYGFWILVLVAMVLSVVVFFCYGEWMVFSSAFKSIFTKTDLTFGDLLGSVGMFTFIVDIAICLVVSAVALLTVTKQIPKWIRATSKKVYKKPEPSLVYTLYKSMKDKVCTPIDLID